LARRAVAAIEHDAHAVEPARDRGGQVVQIALGQRGVGDQRQRRTGGLSGVTEDLLLDQMLFFIRQFVTGMAEDLDAVILVRIMRGGDHHASGESSGASQIRHAGRSDDARGNRADVPLREAGGHLRGDPRSGFARVHADEHGGARRRAAQVARERHAKGVHRCRIQRVIARYAAYAVRAE
jgi:hypothetical protein